MSRAEWIKTRQAGDTAPGYPDPRPVVDWTGSRDHRGRRFPVGGCGCPACLSAQAFYKA